MSTSHIFTNLDFSIDIDVRDQALKELERRIFEAPVDVREPLRDYTPDADQYQSRLIAAPESNIRLVAPAGAGKTQTVINRVISRIGGGLRPDRILVLTFDNAAATSLREKLNAVLQKTNAQLTGLRISTLNAFGYQLLREYFPVEFKPVIPDYRRRRSFREVQDALKEKSAERYAALPGNLAPRFYLEFFSLLKNELIDPRAPQVGQAVTDLMLAREQAKPFFTNPSDRTHVQKVIESVIWLFRAFDLACQDMKLLDFDDQKLRAYMCLTANPGVLSSLQTRLSEVIVDEFQDINRLDFAFVECLSKKSTLVVVGDDDQAIYGFRGCSPDYILDLERHLQRPVASYELQVNYRCPPNIVTHADLLIRHNRRRLSKSPIAHRKDPANIKVVASLSAGLEARVIVQHIRRVRRANRSLGFQDFAVLYRTNAQSLPLQVEFVLQQIPYYVREEDNILENDSLERLLGVLRLKIAVLRSQPVSVKDLTLAIASYFRFTESNALGRIEKGYVPGDPFGFLASESFYACIPKARQSSLVPNLREVVSAKSLLDTLDVLSKRFHGLGGMIGSLEDVIDEKVPLGEVYELAANFRGNTEEFVKTMQQALDQARNSGAGRDEKAGVKLLTYFKAKGLQWNTVVLTTCNEGIIPHKRAPLEDERRLFYVAMTRVSSNLLVSYVRQACGNSVSPSRFLTEAGLLKK